MGKDVEQQETPLPHDNDAEQNVLSGILLEPDRLPTLGLKTSDFFDAWNRDVFKCMLALQRAGLPLTWVRMHQELLSQAGQGDDAPTISYLSDLFNDGTTTAYLSDDASIVREKARKRAFLERVPLLTKRSQNGTRTDALEEQWTEAVALLKEDKPEAVTELFTSVGELLDMPDEPIPWAIHEMLPHGALTIIAAEPGAGKSTWLRNLAVCVAQGRPFQGRAVKQGPVLLFSLEEYKPMVAEHMRKMGADREDPLHIRFDPLDDAVSQVRAAVERLKPAMVIIDPLPKFVAIDDLNSYGQVSPAMDALVQLAHEGDGTNIVVVTHTNKEGEDKRPGGSIAFAASADVILHLAVEGDKRRRVISGVKNRFDERFLLEPTVLGLNPDTGHIEALGSKADAVYRDLGADMLAALEGGPMKNADLLASVTGSNANKSRTVIRLQEVGKITRTPDPDGKGLICTLAQKSSSSSSQLFPEGREEVNQPALPLPPLITGGRGRGDTEEKTMNEQKPKNIDERLHMSPEEEADEVLHSPAVWQLIDEHWPPAGIDPETCSDEELTPEHGSPADHAMLLADLLTERGHTLRQHEIVDKYRVMGGFDPYDSAHNAAAVIEQFQALAASA